MHNCRTKNIENVLASLGEARNTSSSAAEVPELFMEGGKELTSIVGQCGRWRCVSKHTNKHEEPMVKNSISYFNEPFSLRTGESSYGHHTSRTTRMQKATPITNAWNSPEIAYYRRIVHAFFLCACVGLFPPISQAAAELLSGRLQIPERKTSVRHKKEKPQGADLSRDITADMAYLTHASLKIAETGIFEGQVNYTGRFDVYKLRGCFVRCETDFLSP